MYSLIALYLLFYDVVPRLQFTCPRGSLSFGLASRLAAARRTSRKLVTVVCGFSPTHLARIICKLVSRYAVHVLSVHEAMSDHR